MLPFSPRLKIALATAEMLAKSEQRLAVTCSDLLAGILSLDGGVADNLLKARGFSAPSVAAVKIDTLSHDREQYTTESLRALSSAMMEASNRSHQLVGIEDMLVGLLTSPSAEISALLAGKSVRSEDLLSALRAEM
jgi:ATP-dependent Clp protease ATP-binding subunit ClpA